MLLCCGIFQFSYLICNTYLLEKGSDILFLTEKIKQNLKSSQCQFTYMCTINLLNIGKKKFHKTRCTTGLSFGDLDKIIGNANADITIPVVRK